MGRVPPHDPVGFDKRGRGRDARISIRALGLQGPREPAEMAPRRFHVRNLENPVLRHDLVRKMNVPEEARGVPGDQRLGRPVQEILVDGQRLIRHAPVRPVR
jgi:hypothetical protein